jgi:hypothetical protein
MIYLLCPGYHLWSFFTSEIRGNLQLRLFIIITSFILLQWFFVSESSIDKHAIKTNHDMVMHDFVHGIVN